MEGSNFAGQGQHYGGRNTLKEITMEEGRLWKKDNIREGTET